MGEVFAIAFAAGGVCTFIFLFLFSWIGIYSGVVRILPEFGRKNWRYWYEYLLLIGSAGVGVLIFAKVFRSGIESLPKRPEPSFGTIDGSPPFFAASIIAILGAAVAFCVSVYLSACIGVWTGLIELGLAGTPSPTGGYETFMWSWSIGLGVVAFWIVYRYILITSRYFQNASHGDSRTAVSK